MALHGHIADFHLDNFSEFKGAMKGGLNYRGELALEVLKRIFEYGLDYLHILGDIFEHPYISVQLLNALMDVLADGVSWGCQVHIIPGNHDMLSGDSGDHVLGPLSKIPGVFVHERPERLKVGALDYFYVPFLPEGSVLDYTFKRAPQVTCIHQGITHEGTSDFLKESGIHRKTLLKWMRSHGKRETSFLLAGDWHDHQPFANGIYQLGTICPHSWADSGLWRGHMLVLDDSTGNPVLHKTPEQIPGPRFLFAVDRKEAIKTAKEMLQQGNTPFIEYPAERGDDGVRLKEQVLPEITGAHFRLEPRKRKKRTLADSEAATERAAADVARRFLPEELLEPYLRERYPTRWEKVLAATIRFIDGKG